MAFSNTTKETIVELGTIADTIGGTFGVTNTLTVFSITATSTSVMSTTGLTFKFNVGASPKADAVKDSDFVALDLPHFWGGVDKMID